MNDGNTSSTLELTEPPRELARRRSIDAALPIHTVRDTQRATVRVVCVDDHSVLIEGLRAQFAIDGHVRCVAALGSAEHLLNAVAEHRPDVVVLDIEMPGPDVFEIADRMRHLYPETRFVFLSAHIRDGFLASAFRCGASGYFAKSEDLEEIVEGLRRVARCAEGTFVMGTKVRARCQPPKKPAGRLSGNGASSSSVHDGRTGSATAHGTQAGLAAHTGLMRGANGAPVTLLDSLTQRELEVLRLIGKGLSRGEIGEELARSPKTIDGHQERIMKKLRVFTRAELMRFAIREGLAQA